jgi:O-acetylhomoserine (thiol)-lyase
VIYSATKALSGHGNLIAGLILESGNFVWKKEKFPQFHEKFYTLRDINDNERSFLDVFPNSPFTGKARMDYLNYFGAALGPFDAYLALIGIETLSERVSKQTSNAKKIAEYLKKNPLVEKVNYAGDSKLAEKYFPKGAGYIISFEIKGTFEQSQRFIDKLKIFSYLANLGDAKSLVIDPFKVTHGELTEAELERAKISKKLIRLSIGLEDADDLIEDLEQAFKGTFYK